MTNMDINYCLVPPSNHRANNAEREIQTFKNHSIAGLCSVDKKFISNCGKDYYSKKK